MALTIKKDDCDLINKDPPITFPYNLDPFQKNAINSIEEGNHVLVLLKRYQIRNIMILRNNMILLEFLLEILNKIQMLILLL